ncbi:ferric iron uptake transcriptional regulator [Acinetobacter populi]|jgi:Fur family ferric uptake transcriptional regulator|uniref:Ferric uptake regulation protein n=1 Tax=Acinetobacter populi TaxID=1582270 RepID=A0A1Z9Z149_9GAMM|nr:ferric iron uptake transcriptional regulator [Acinetobacter populi]MCH4248261.1 ferric iron uptake transcriptional regulator [Acinetobacter populi]OUY08184.1 ferric iron uptake transcriptional regulator [Acinetobacter populi]
MAITNQDLRKAGLKVTLPRIKILELLENSKQHHLSAEDIYKTLLEQGEDVGLATVYRVLTQFEAAGIIQRHHFDNNHSVFEIMQEDHHDHLVCQSCNKVVEFTNDTIEEEQHTIAEQHGFTLTGHSLNLYGYCDSPECQEALKKK